MALLDSMTTILGEFAEDLEFKDCCSFLPDAKSIERLPIVALIGEFKRGKTSIIDALLSGKRYRRPPATKDIVVYLHREYAEELWYETVKGKLGIPKVKLQKIDAAILKKIIVVDTPGFNDPSLEIDDLVFALLPKCYKIFLVLSAKQALSRFEEKIVQRLLGEDKRKLSVILHCCDVLSSIRERYELERRIQGKLERFINPLTIIPTSVYPDKFKTGIQDLKVFLDHELYKFSQEYCRDISDRIDVVLSNLQWRCTRLKQEISNAQQKIIDQLRVEENIRSIYQTLQQEVPPIVEHEMIQSKAHVQEQSDGLSPENLAKQIEEILEQELQGSLEKIFDRILNQLQRKHETCQVSDKSLRPFFHIRSWGKIYHVPFTAPQKIKDGWCDVFLLFFESIMQSMPLSGGLVVMKGLFIAGIIKKLINFRFRDAQKRQLREQLDTNTARYYDRLPSRINQEIEKMLDEMLAVELEFFRPRLPTQVPSCYSLEKLEHYEKKIEQARQQLLRSLQSNVNEST